MNDMRILILLFIVLLVILLFSKAGGTHKIMPLMYFIGALACSYAMIFSPTYPKRAMFGVFAALIIAIFSCIMELQNANAVSFTSQKMKIAVASVLACLTFFFVFSYATASLDFARMWNADKKRTAYILAEKEKGNLDIVISQRFIVGSKYNPMTDITKDPSNWINEAVARYYQINSIKLSE